MKKHQMQNFSGMNKQAPLGKIANVKHLFCFDLVFFVIE